jgi:hypothetical protein
VNFESEGFKNLWRTLQEVSNVGFNNNEEDTGDWFKDIIRPKIEDILFDEYDIYSLIHSLPRTIDLERTGIFTGQALETLTLKKHRENEELNLHFDGLRKNYGNLFQKCDHFDSLLFENFSESILMPHSLSKKESAGKKLTFYNCKGRLAGSICSYKGRLDSLVIANSEGDFVDSAAYYCSEIDSIAIVNSKGEYAFFELSGRGSSVKQAYVLDSQIEKIAHSAGLGSGTIKAILVDNVISYSLLDGAANDGYVHRIFAANSTINSLCEDIGFEGDDDFMDAYVGSVTAHNIKTETKLPGSMKHDHMQLGSDAAIDYAFVTKVYNIDLIREVSQTSRKGTDVLKIHEIMSDSKYKELDPTQSYRSIYGNGRRGVYMKNILEKLKEL